MSQTTDIQPTFEEEEAAYLYLLSESGQYLQTFGLLGGLYGVLTVLSVLSVYALIQHKARRTQPASIILCLVILTLFISTTTYLVTVAMAIQYDLSSTILPQSMDVSGDIDRAVDNSNWKEVEKYMDLGYCASTAALTFNITLGDAIVCWRASIVWQRNAVVKAICGAFLLATFVLGVIDTTSNACGVNMKSIQVGLGSMYRGIPIGISIYVLSFSTNLLATLLVGYKAWQWRRHLKGYLVSGSRVEKLLALLIESGAGYCALWGTVIIYQVVLFDSIYSDSVQKSVEISFINIFGVIFGGGLVPLVAIYPTVIIVLVAHNRSQIEKGLLPNLDSLPTPHLAVTVNTTMTSEGTQHQTLEVLVFGPDGQGPGRTDEVEEPDMRTSKGWESGSIA